MGARLPYWFALYAVILVACVGCATPDRGACMDGTFKIRHSTIIMRGYGHVVVEEPYWYCTEWEFPDGHPS